MRHRFLSTGEEEGWRGQCTKRTSVETLKVLMPKLMVGMRCNNCQIELKKLINKKCIYNLKLCKFHYQIGTFSNFQIELC